MKPDLNAQAPRLHSTVDVPTRPRTRNPANNRTEHQRPAWRQWYLRCLTWAFMLLVAFDIWRMWRGFKQLAAERIPNEPLKGLLYYGFNRALSLRRLRIPRPVLKRGDSF